MKLLPIADSVDNNPFLPIAKSKEKRNNWDKGASGVQTFIVSLDMAKYIELDFHHPPLKD